LRDALRASDYAYAVQCLRGTAGAIDVDGDPVGSFDLEKPIVAMETFEGLCKDQWESHSCTPLMCSEEDKEANIEKEKQRKALLAQSREGTQTEGRM
jgi:hypothetical protein